MKSIGIEITPQAIRAARLEPASQTLCDEREYAFPEHLADLPDLHKEVSPAAVVQTVLMAINDLCGDIDSDVEIWICGRTGGLVLADELGRAHSNFISWNDRRAEQLTVMNKSQLARLFDQWSDPRFGGIRRELQASSMFAILYILADSGLLPDGVLPLTIHDFLISHLCRQPGTMHCTLGLGLLDHQTNDWFYKAFERAGLGDLWLPEITQGLAYVGHVKSGTRTFHFRPPVADLQAMLWGNHLSPKELGFHFAGHPRMTAIQYGNGALAASSIPYFEQQRLLSSPLPEGVWSEAESVDLLTPDQFQDAARQCELAVQAFIDLTRFDSILISGVSAGAAQILAGSLAERFQKNTRNSATNAGLLGLMKLAQTS